MLLKRWKAAAAAAVVAAGVALAGGAVAVPQGQPPATPPAGAKAAAPKADPRPDDREAVRGTWVVERAETGGTPFTPVPRTVTLVVGKDTMTWTGLGKASEENPLTYKLDPTRTPGAIDLVAPDLGDPARGVGPFHAPHLVGKLAGIYRLGKDRLELCYASGDRPTEFATAKGGRVVWIVFKRAPVPPAAGAAGAAPGDAPKPGGKTPPEATGLSGKWQGEQEDRRIEITFKAKNVATMMVQKKERIGPPGGYIRTSQNLDVTCAPGKAEGEVDLLYVGRPLEPLPEPIPVGRVVRGKDGKVAITILPKARLYWSFEPVADFALAPGETGDPKQLDGSYAVLESVSAGKAAPAEIKEFKFAIKDGVITVGPPDGTQPERRFKFALDASTEPARIDLTPLDPDAPVTPEGAKRAGPSETIRGIYRTKTTAAGLELTIALTGLKGVWPENFDGKAPEEWVLRVVRAEK